MPSDKEKTAVAPDGNTAPLEVVATETYAVGYKRPPRETQFKKGQSGNPGGPKKGKKRKKDLSEAALLARLLKQTVEVGPERLKLRPIEIVFKSTLKEVSKGSTRAATLMLEFVRMAAAAEDDDGLESVFGSATPEEIVAAHDARIRKVDS